MSAKVIMIDPGKQYGQAVVYAYSSPYADHNGLLKIGQVKSFTIEKGADVKDNSEYLRSIAHGRIRQQTHEYSAKFEIEFVTLFRYEIVSGDGTEADIDDMVRKVLTNSGFKKAHFDHEHGDEWIECTKNAVKAAVNAVNQNRTALNPEEIADLKHNAIPFSFYPHQKDCLDWTKTGFKTKDSLLWEIKPRGGKTVTAIEITRRLGMKKTLVYTARPDVNEEWKGAFDMIFASGKGGAEWVYGSRSGQGVSSFSELMRESDSGKNVMWFASTQFLRRTDDTSTAEERKQILETKWDFIIIDEAHEATLTELGQMVELKAKKDKTKVLKLSGTPFNLLDQYSKDEVFTFDYNEEQRRKEEWDEKKEGYANPYARMPQIHLRTVALAEMVMRDKTDDNAFSFKEFFRVKDGSESFVHEKEIVTFLNLLKDEDKHSFYPFCCDQNRGFFRHTLWVVPGVAAGAALSRILQTHPYFKGYKVINVCGPGDEEVASEKATKMVRDGIANYWRENKFGTITLSCGKLTTGVTIPEWTGVLMLKGGNSTDAKLYLQTAFRVQGPYDSPEGIRKTSCYVFDFAPDRALTVLCSVCQANKNGDKAESKQKASELLKFFPVLSYNGNKLDEHNVDSLFRWYNKAAAERVMANGFDDNRLYNWDKIREAAGSDAILDEIKESWGGKKSGANPNKYDVNAQGADGEGGEKSEIRWTCPNCGKKDIVGDVCPNCGTEKPKKKWICPNCGHVNYGSKYCGNCGKPKPELPKDETKNRAKALINTLKNISIRIPLLAFGAEVTKDEEFRLDNFASLVDDASWKEFMPEGFPKVTDGKLLGFDYFKQFIDEDVFVIACTETRNELKAADDLLPEERVKTLIEIIGKFKNPAKETIITPWPVVNLHLGETVGGEVFYDIEGQNFRRALPEPKLIDHSGEGIQDAIHSDVFYDENAKILEINSKSGVYPLFLAYSLYKIHSSKDGGKTFEVDVWKQILEKNIYVLCQTEMAVKITNRVLRGFHKDWKTNCVYKENLIETFKNRYNSEDDSINEINTPAFWGKEGDDMIRFTLAASNPPYQGESHAQIYPLFYLTAIEVADTVSMIFPSNWQEASKKSAKGLSRMNNETVKQDHQIVFIDNRKDVFEGIAGAADTNIILWKKDFDNGLDGSQLVYTEGKGAITKRFNIDVADIEKPQPIRELFACVRAIEGESFTPIDVSKFDPYRVPSNILSPKKNPLATHFTDAPASINDIGVWGFDGKRLMRYHINDFEEVKVTKKDGTLDHIDCVSKSTKFKFRKADSVDKFKVIIPKLWGNMDASCGIGGAFSDLQIIGKNQICTYSFNTCGVYPDKETTVKAAKYLFTKFARALLYINKHGKDATAEAFPAIPLQDFHESWWNESIAQIDEHLFDKYNVPEPIRDFVRKNIQTKTEDNIIGL